MFLIVFGFVKRKRRGVDSKLSFTIFMFNAMIKKKKEACFMELNQVLETRRSIRQYQNKEVSKEDIETIIEAAIQAPSWKNSQTARYYVVMSKELLAKIKEECLPQFNATNCQDAPVLIISTFVKNRSGFERDGTPSNEVGQGWGYYDCGLHNENLVLKATDLGLDTLIMGIRDAKKLAEILNISESEQIVSVISVGYRAIEPQKPKRKSVEEIAKFY